MRKLNNKGFTIIELLVVIVIIGILVALTLPNLFSAQARGRDTDRKNELKNLQQQLETYFNDNGSYPAALADLSPAPGTEETTDPRNNTYGYDVEPTGCTTAADDCTEFTLSADLENDDDADAIDDNGTYQLTSVNE